jgi:DNA-binding MarR family transcriptional regulator
MTHSTVTSTNLDSVLFQFVISMNERRSTILTNYGISENDIEIVRYLNANEVKKMKELGEQFDLKFSTLTSTIDRLEQNRLVKRRNSKDDRRVVFVQINQRGQQLLTDLDEMYQKVAENFSDLNEEALNAMVVGLNAVIS